MAETASRTRARFLQTGESCPGLSGWARVGSGAGGAGGGRGRLPPGPVWNTGVRLPFQRPDDINEGVSVSGLYAYLRRTSDRPGLGHGMEVVYRAGMPVAKRIRGEERPDWNSKKRDIGVMRGRN